MARWILLAAAAAILCLDFWLVATDRPASPGGVAVALLFAAAGMMAGRRTDRPARARRDHPAA